jgi:CDP-diacylglycerol--glycerol-3-phosphate 3-phosphatidyltransferase
MTIYALKPAFRKALEPVGRRLVRAHVSPDSVTLAGVFFAMVGGLGLLLGREGEAWLVLFPAAALLRTAANALDGWIAQETGTNRALGEVLNETCDRVADVVMVIPLGLVSGVPDLLVAATLAAMLITSFIGVAVKAAGGSRVYAGVMGKPDRMLVLAVAAIAAMFLDPHIALSAGLWVVFTGAIITIIQRAVIARRELAGRR